jgi:hypothetical protein
MRDGGEACTKIPLKLGLGVLVSDDDYNTVCRGSRMSHSCMCDDDCMEIRVTLASLSVS